MGNKYAKFQTIYWLLFSLFKILFYLGRVFVISGYTEEIHEELVNVICINGGTVAEISSPHFIDYSIVPLQGEGDFHPNAKHYVTHMYIEDCIEQEVLGFILVYLKILKNESRFEIHMWGKKN